MEAKLQVISCATPDSYYPFNREPQDLHRALIAFNSRRLLPSLPDSKWEGDVDLEAKCRLQEGAFVERERSAIAPAAAKAPSDTDGFMAWFHSLRDSGPGQHDPLFPWLATSATHAEMCWFLAQEAAGEAGFEDLVALVQVRFPTRAKLELARNYWDEMGRGHERGMHGPMLARTVEQLGLRPTAETTVWESLALSNLMVALAANRRYAYHAIGALGVIEMTAPGRVARVNEGLTRLGVPADTRMYFQLHAGLDIKHSEAWNREIIAPLVEANPRVARAIAEGALMRLASGARCFKRYRRHFGFPVSSALGQVEQRSVP